MSEPGSSVTQAQFYERMQMLEDKMQEYHRRSREHVDGQITLVLAAFKSHELDDDRVATRVTVIEAERGIEKRAAATRSVIAGSIGAGFVVGLIESGKKLLGWR